MFDERMLLKADKLSDEYGAVKLTLTDGRVVYGVSWGIQPLRDDETGDTLEEDCIAVKMLNGLYDEFRNCEIKDVEGYKRG